MLDTLHCKLHATKSPVYYDEASFAFLVSEGKTTDQREVPKPVIWCASLRMTEFRSQLVTELWSGACRIRGRV